MAKSAKTAVKRGNPKLKDIEGQRFTSDNQPTPEQKKAGWENWRKERHLTQSIIKELTAGENLLEYTRALFKLAKEGNPKAIDAVNKCLEDDITKVEHTGIQPTTLIFSTSTGCIPLPLPNAENS